MPHDTPLIATLVGAFVLAFVFGAIAQRLRLSPLVGYLLAGVMAGPFTPGFVADQHLAGELAELGVILLMFGVGLHFSLKDLLSVKAIAVPGAVLQISVATLLGMGLAYFMGWSVGSGLVFGLSLSTASTVVLLRAMQERRLIESEQGRIAVGWLIVEDLAMVLALVLLPAFASALGSTSQPMNAASAWFGPMDVWTTLGVTLAKVLGFVLVMLVVGRRLIPWIMNWVALLGSRELFRLAVLAIALGVAYGAAVLFGVSFALGAFFAGMVLSESPLAHRAAEESLPLRDAFAVLFFVSVGMMVDPANLLNNPLALLATVAIVLVGKSLAALALVRLFGYGLLTALTISVSLAQIGEFSFILMALGLSLGLFPEEAQDLILATAIFSIMINPFLFLALDRFRAKLADPVADEPVPETVLVPTMKSHHTILVGYGQIGILVGEGLKAAGLPVVVIEDQEDRVAEARAGGLEVLDANAAIPETIEAANVAGAERIIIAIPHNFDAGGIIRKTRALNRNIEIIARTHSESEVEALRESGADFVIVGEREVARGMLSHALAARSVAGRGAGQENGPMPEGGLPVPVVQRKSSAPQPGPEDRAEKAAPQTEAMEPQEAQRLEGNLGAA
ncbi:YbaL family putative K(+) efflux transporter [Xanthobacter sp. TB0139]|uniref:YbaL family putative K(+) efflux transporter n=1 Tax=Xanthobacter sp. TB0139 TaxID=3459178 RepID=UPI00403A41E1